MKNISLYNDKCEPVLDNLAENSVDNVVTDPPYGIQFMNKKWDYDVPSVELWEKVYRVMKPGATLLCFAGTRTQHRMAVNIEDAGFILKDVIMWLYGTGFPKGSDISKQLDKMAGKSFKWFIDYVLKVAEEKGITKKQLTDLFLSKNGLPTGWLYNKASGNQSLTLEQYNKLKDFLDLPFDTLEEAEREIIGKKRAGLGSGETYAFTDNNETDGEVDVTLPNTPEAKLWSGWKSHALKPAYEPIIMAIKPNEGSYVENALKHGTAGLNIGDSRIGLQGEKQPSGSAKRVYKSNQYTEDKTYGKNKETPIEGRYPANVILSHHPDCKLKGTKKIDGRKGVIGFRSGDGEIYGKYKDRVYDKAGEYSDKDGKETVEDWNCHPDCPVKMLDDQGGIRKSGTIKEHHNIGDEKGEKYRDNEIFGVYKMHDDYKPASYGDEGGTSRYYKTFGGEWECHPDCPVKMLDDQSGITKDVSRTAKVTDSKPISDEKGWNAHSMKHGVQDAPGAYEDEGGASRFFHKVEDWDCHPDCPVKMLDEQSGETISKGGQIATLTGKDSTGFPFHKAPGEENIRETEKGDPGFGDEGGASRFFYCAKASQSERNAGCDELDDKKFGFSGGANQALNEGKDEYLQDHIGLNKIRTLKNNHPTVKPIKLMEYLCKLISNPESNIYLDPFMGSGTTGIAVSNLGFDFIGIEMDKGYFKIAEKRIGFSQKDEIQLEKRQKLFDNFFE